MGEYNSIVLRRLLVVCNGISFIFTTPEKQSVRMTGKDTAQGLPKWDRTADIVVLGFGAAGAAAAIEAHDGGAEVLILERADSGGGTTKMSGGGFSAPASAEKVMETAAYLNACGMGRVLPNMVNAWCTEALTTPQWARDVLGAEVTEQVSHPPSNRGGYHHGFKGFEQLVSWRFPKGGAEMFERLENAVTERGIEVLYRARGRELVRNAGGAIAGVRVIYENKPLVVGARKAVILCCGGFGFDDELKRQFLRPQPNFSTGVPTCTGDGIRMGQQVGGAIQKMAALSGALVYRVPGFDVACTSLLQADAARRPGIIVNRHGKRFANEELTYDAFNLALGNYDPTKREYTNVPAYTIFDENSRKQGPIAHAFRENITSVTGYEWSKDSLAEVEKGWVMRSDTIEGLAETCRIDTATLAETLEKYNDYCTAGEDPEFGRKHGLLPLQTPPYYAVEAWPGFWDTCGGLKINKKSQVVDALGHFVRRLYAAGTTANGTVGFYYPIRGHCIGDALAFGRIAGRNAAKEKSGF